MKLFLGIAALGDDSISVYGSSVSKCIKGGVGFIVVGNVGWDVCRTVGDRFDNDVVGEVGSGYDA